MLTLTADRAAGTAAEVDDGPEVEGTAGDEAEAAGAEADGELEATDGRSGTEADAEAAEAGAEEGNADATDEGLVFCFLRGCKM